MAWTTADDVLDAWIGDDAPSDSILIDTWIGKAERLIRFHIPGIQARIDGALEPDLLPNVVDVVVAMVARVFRNPTGVRQVNTTTGPFTDSMTYGGDTPGTLALTDAELLLLAGTGSSGQKAYTIDMIPATSPYSPYYVHVWPWDL